jgi:outer membrane protein OmpA-like peptidoglycan-associated protein|tara:strand:+ start:26 stop:1018 length:993 start_codon:yes stop_codon:yes gene_type:complete
MNKFKLFLILIFFPALLFSQKTRSIDGVVKDKNTGTEIENASVSAKPVKRSGGGFYTGEVTKKNGIFSVRSSFRFPLELTVQIKGCGKSIIIIKKEGFYEVLLDCGKEAIKQIILEQNPPPILGVKLDNGNTLSAISLDIGNDVYLVNEDGKRIALKKGEYLLENSKSITINDQGVITNLVDIIIEIDTDGDGVIDENDICPDEAGDSINNGCPKNPKELREFTSNEKSLILFSVNSSKVNNEAIFFLSNLVLKLKKYTNSNLIISGHSSIDGSSNYNQILSEKRANSVKEILINSGIDSQRLKTIGYGEKKPIKGNSRKQNRRVIISLN